MLVYGIRAFSFHIDQFPFQMQMVQMIQQPAQISFCDLTTPIPINAMHSGLRIPATHSYGVKPIRRGKHLEGDRLKTVTLPILD